MPLLGEQLLEHRQQDPDQRADQDRPAGRHRQAADPGREHARHGDPCLRRGQWILLERGGIRNHQVPGGHDRERAEEDAHELRDELLARIGAEQVAALEVGEQIR